MVSILPMVDLLGNTEVDWFCILSYFRLDTLCLSVQRTFTFRIYACSNLTQVCNISLVQSAASADSTSTVHAYLQRESRLQQRRDRLNAESTEERQARLQQRRDRLNADSPEERQARLQQRRDRLNAESPEERQARLQQRRDRLNAESAEETQAKDVID